MIITLTVQNVRTYTPKDPANKKERCILRDPENTCEKFFHYDCKNETEEEILKASKEASFEVHAFNTQYSDTMAIQGKLLAKVSKS